MRAMLDPLMCSLEVLCRVGTASKRRVPACPAYGAPLAAAGGTAAHPCPAVAPGLVWLCGVAAAGQSAAAYFASHDACSADQPRDLFCLLVCCLQGQQQLPDEGEEGIAQQGVAAEHADELPMSSTAAADVVSV